MDFVESCPWRSLRARATCTIAVGDCDSLPWHSPSADVAGLTISLSPLMLPLFPVHTRQMNDETAEQTNLLQIPGGACIIPGSCIPNLFVPFTLVSCPVFPAHCARSPNKALLFETLPRALCHRPLQTSRAIQRNSIEVPRLSSFSCIALRGSR